jgi:hypothetical protein
MKKRFIGALLVGGAVLVGPLAMAASAHPAHAASAARLTDHCVVVPVGSLQITLCVPT